MAINIFVLTLKEFFSCLLTMRKPLLYPPPTTPKITVTFSININYAFGNLFMCIITNVVGLHNLPIPSILLIDKASLIKISIFFQSYICLYVCMYNTDLTYTDRTYNIDEKFLVPKKLWGAITQYIHETQTSINTAKKKNWNVRRQMQQKKKKIKNK